MTNLECEAIFDRSSTRAYLQTPDGIFVCSRMKVAGELCKPDSVTLTPVGRTRDISEARMWIVFGIVPQAEG